MAEPEFRVTRGREITFNPSPYESIKVFASLSRNLSSDFDPEFEAREFDGILTDLLAQEIEEVAAVTRNPKSVVHEYRVSEPVNN